MNCTCSISTGRLIQCPECRERFERFKQAQPKIDRAELMKQVEKLSDIELNNLLRGKGER